MIGELVEYFGSQVKYVLWLCLGANFYIAVNKQDHSSKQERGQTLI